MKPRGIPIAQIETNIEADPKFLKLRMRLDSPTTYYAVVGAYTSIVLRAWATGSREPDPDHLDLIPTELLDYLRAVGLLDADGAIPAAVFDRWVGAVIDARQSRQEQLAAIASEGGKARSRGPRDSAGRLISPAVTAGQPAVTAGYPAVSPLLSSAGNTAGDTYEPGVDGGVQGGWPYLYPVVVELTGKHVPHGKFANDLCELAEQAGPEVVVAAMRAVAASMAPVKPDIRALAFGVNDAIRRPPSGREVAGVVQDEQERAYTARKAAERAQARLDRQRRALALVGDLEAADAPS